MSEEANHKKEDSEDIDKLLQFSDQNRKRTLERQVTKCDEEEVKMIQETSFNSNIEDVQLSTEKVKENHSSSELDDHIINTVNSNHNIAKENDVNIEEEQHKKCQCLFEVFECTIWALRNMAYSMYSFFRRNCCFCCARKVDLGKRELNDDDGDYWDGNLVENDDGDHCTYNLNNDGAHERKATFHFNEAFDEGTNRALKNHCINKSFVGDTETSNSVDENKTEKKEGNDIEVEDSASNAVCHVKIHHETHRNDSLVDTSGGNDISGGGSGGHDISGGDSSGHDFSGGDGGGCAFTSD